MGYIRHKAMIVQGHIGKDLPFETIEDCHKEIEVLYNTAVFPNAGNFGQLVSPLLPHMTNGTASFFIAPDGSKEGWETSNQGDELMEKAKAICDKHDCRYAIVVMGGDDGQYKVIEHNDRYADDETYG